MKLKFTLILIFLGLTLVGKQNGVIHSLKERLNTAKGNERAEVLNQLAGHLKEDTPKLARKYAEEAYSISAASNNPESTIIICLQLAEIELKLGREKKAIEYAKKGLKLSESSNNVSLQIKSLYSLETIYSSKKRFSKALKETQLIKQELLSDLALNEKANRLSKLTMAYDASQSANNRYKKQKNELKTLLLESEKLNALEALRQDSILREKLALELELSQLREDSTRKELEISNKTNQMLAAEAVIKEQKFWQTLLSVGLIAALGIIFVLFQNARLRRLRQQEKERSQQQLMQQEKMASLGQLTAGIAHEIKNPLNFVNNFADVSMELTDELADVLEEMPTSPQVEKVELGREIIGDLKENMADIKENGQRIDTIVYSMMEHARGNSGVLEKSDLNELVKSSLNLAYQGYRGNHPTFNAALEEDYDDNIGMVNLVRQDFSRALLNLFGNACYALHQKQDQNIPNYISTIRVKTEKINDEILISIWDNGHGIPEQVQQKIFEPFFTTKPTGDGNTGLGLSITHDIIVQGHQGSISVESKPEEYTQFLIKVPA